MSFAWGTLSIQEYTLLAVFLADHSRLELIFSLDRTQHSFKCDLIISVSLGACSFLIPKSSDVREGRGLSVARRVVE